MLQVVHMLGQNHSHWPTFILYVNKTNSFVTPGFANEGCCLFVAKPCNFYDGKLLYSCDRTAGEFEVWGEGKTAADLVGSKKERFDDSPLSGSIYTQLWPVWPYPKYKWVYKGYKWVQRSNLYWEHKWVIIGNSQCSAVSGSQLSDHGVTTPHCNSYLSKNGNFD